MHITPGASLSHDRATRRGRRRVPLRLLAIAAVGSFVLDQLTKIAAVASLKPGQPVELVGEVLQLQLIRNPGAAFSLATGMTWVLTAVALVVVVVVLRAVRRITSTAWALALGLLLGGALGNLADRLFRAPGIGQGHVVDFIAYGGLFVGNIADIAIVMAAVLIGILALRGVGMEGKRA
ncbi:MAG: signal peptidase II [Angustibacter sp.]